MIKYSFIKKMIGHRNSKGEVAEWCILSENDNKVLSSHKTKEEAVSHLKDIEGHKSAFILELNSSLSICRVANVIEGGKGDNLDIKIIPKKELSKGMKVESEHTPDPEIQKDIVKDHEFEAIELTGKPNYYTFLEEMEKKMKEI